MTQEEKAYDKALERAKVIYHGSYKPDTAATIAEVLQDVFPELKESEDERVRKDCIKYLNLEYQHCPLNEDKIKIEKCIAWFENQGKQKELNKIEHNIIDIPFGVKDSELQEAMYTIPAGFYAEIKGNEVFIKKGEQPKPAWSEEDERKLEVLKTLIEDVKENSTSYSTMFREMNELNNWLESFKDRALPKQEWSEEDENMYKRIHKLINSVPYCDSRKEYSDWLKSLKDKHTWKPSDEQMKALNLIIIAGNISSVKQVQELTNLYKDLKKLRKE